MKLLICIYKQPIESANFLSQHSSSKSSKVVVHKICQTEPKSIFKTPTPFHSLKVHQ